MAEKLTKQEMFDRAYRGLASQGWQRCMNEGDCAYASKDGTHCAWGWVDPESWSRSGDVEDLRTAGIGVAALLTEQDLKFAKAMQMIHDYISRRPMQERLIELARCYDLTIPELP